MLCYTNKIQSYTYKIQSFSICKIALLVQSLKNTKGLDRKVRR